jgi:hypothetical protein
MSEALWLRQIIGQMMYLGSNIKLVKLYRDNQGLLSLAENPGFYQQTKYSRTASNTTILEIKYYKISI